MNEIVSQGSGPKHRLIKHPVRFAPFLLKWRAAEVGGPVINSDALPANDTVHVCHHHSA